MPKETTREISRDVTYTSKNGKIVKRTVIYEIVGNAKWVEDGKNDNPTVEAFKEAVLNKNKNDNKDGYISRNY